MRLRDLVDQLAAAEQAADQARAALHREVEIAQIAQAVAGGSDLLAMRRVAMQ